jgi:hypothetical protein
MIFILGGIIGWIISLIIIETTGVSKRHHDYIGSDAGWVTLFWVFIGLCVGFGVGLTLLVQKTHPIYTIWNYLVQWSTDLANLIMKSW